MTLAEIVEKPVADLSVEDKAVLVEQEDRLTDEQKEKFADVLKAPDAPDAPATQEGGGDAPATQEGGGDAPATQEGGGDAPATQEGGGDAPATQEGGADAGETKKDEGGSE